jgi:hypothetical protein
MPYTTVAKVAEYARNLEVKYGQMSTITADDVQIYVNDADTYLDARLNHAYYTPLQQITRGGVTKYPDPIPLIATKVAAAMAVRSIYSRIDPQVSTSAEQHLNDALRELNRFTEGTYQGTNRLDGQVLKARNFFINPQVAPLDPPQKQAGI